MLTTKIILSKFQFHILLTTNIWKIKMIVKKTHLKERQIALWYKPKITNNQ